MKSTLIIVVLVIAAAFFALDLGAFWPSLEAVKKEYHPFAVSAVLVFSAWFVHWSSLRITPDDDSSKDDLK